MDIRIVENESYQEEWNAVAPHPLVSWEWGAARAKMGIDILRLGVFKNEKLVDVFQSTFHKIPGTHFTVGYMPRTRIPTSDLLRALKIEAQRRLALYVKIEPYVTVEEVVPDREEFFEICQKSQHPLFPEWTQSLDLQPTEDELLSHMKSKWRYNIRLAQKKGVHVLEKTTQEGFQIFQKLYFETTARQKYHGHTPLYHEIVFETLKDRIGHILIAEYEGMPLAAYHLFLLNGTLYYPYGGSSEEHRNVMASHLIMWEAIKFGKLHGATRFDMWGSLPPQLEGTESSSDWSGFTRFKEGFGTQYVQYVGSYDYVLSPFGYMVYSVADRLRKRFLL